MIVNCMPKKCVWRLEMWWTAHKRPGINLQPQSGTWQWRVARWKHICFCLVCEFPPITSTREPCLFKVTNQNPDVLHWQSQFITPSNCLPGLWSDHVHNLFNFAKNNGLNCTHKCVYVKLQTQENMKLAKQIDVLILLTEARSASPLSRASRCLKMSPAHVPSSGWVILYWHGGVITPYGHHHDDANEDVSNMQGICPVHLTANVWTVAEIHQEVWIVEELVRIRKQIPTSQLIMCFGQIPRPRTHAISNHSITFQNWLELLRNLIWPGTRNPIVDDDEIWHRFYWVAIASSNCEGKFHWNRFHP